MVCVCVKCTVGQEGYLEVWFIVMLWLGLFANDITNSSDYLGRFNAMLCRDLM